MSKPLFPWNAGARTGLPFHAANKNVLGEFVLTRLILQPSLRRSFGGVYMHVDPAALAMRRATVPVIFCATHSGWWDGHMAYLLNDRIFKHDAYLMMEEVHLARYPFFTWGGVFGVDRDDVRKALSSIEYIASLLKERPGRALWMFPQGTMRHADERPLKIYGGAANVARKVGECAIVPVAVRYDFLMEQAPDAFVRIGPPLPGTRGLPSREITSLLTQALTHCADGLRRDVTSYDLGAYKRVYAGRGSVNRRWDGVTGLISRLKSSLTGR